MLGGAQYSQDEPPLGDVAFSGVSMRSKPAATPAGFGTAAVNMRFDDRVAQIRRGGQLLCWANRAAEASATVQAFGEVHGAGVFRDPNDTDWIIIAADGKVYYLREHLAARELPLPDGEIIEGEVDFVQCFDQLLMLRGANRSTLVLRDINQSWTLPVQVDDDPDNVGQNPTDGTEQIPNGQIGLSMQNRFLGVRGRDEVACSDFLNYTRYQPVLEAFRINAGDSETITGLWEINSNSLLVGKSGSIHVVSGLSGNLSGLSRTSVTGEYGLVSHRAIITSGRDVWFFANRRGVCSVTQTEQGKYMGVDVPKSWDIQPLIDRINWSMASRFLAAKVGDKSYWGVALDAGEARGRDLLAGETLGTGSGAERLGLETGDGETGTIGLETGDGFSGSIGIETGDGGSSGGGSAGELVIAVETGAKYLIEFGDETSLVNGSETLTSDSTFTAQGSSVTLTGTAGAAVTAALRRIYTDVLNAILVYDHRNQAWCGHDEGELIQPFRFLVKQFRGEERLFMLTSTGYLVLYEELGRDQVDAETFQEIEWRFDTRGYASLSKLGRLRAREMTIQMQTWNPLYSVHAILDGVAEVVTVAEDATRDRTRYERPFTAPRWVESNINGDHGTAFREDYSVLIGSDDSRFYHSTRVNFSAQQEVTETYRCSPAVRGRTVQFRLSGRQGRVELHGVDIEAVRVDRSKGRKT